MVHNKIRNQETQSARKLHFGQSQFIVLFCVVEGIIKINKINTYNCKNRIFVGLEYEYNKRNWI